MSELEIKRGKNNSINIIELLINYKKHWYLFVGCFVLAALLAVVYLKKTEPIYLIYSNLIINDEEKAGAGGGFQASLLKNFSSLGGMIGGGTVDDEIVVLTSHSLMREAVQDLGLNVSYDVKKRFFYKTAYDNSPITISTQPSILDTLSVGLQVKMVMSKDGELEVNMKKGWRTIAKEKSRKFPLLLNTKYGPFVIDTTSFYKPGKSTTVKAFITGYDSFTEEMEKKVNVSLISKKSNGIYFELLDVNIKRGKDLLNKLMNLYNKNGEIEKNKNASVTAQFIDKRLEILFDELAIAEKNVEDYKKKNNLTDLEIEAKVTLEQAGDFKEKLIAAETQLSVITMVDNFLRNASNKYALVPFTTGLPDKTAADAIQSYNEVLLKRIQLLRTAGEKNQSIQNINEQIDAMRENVLTTVTKAKESSRIVRDDLKKQEDIFLSRIKDMPTQEREFLELKRQQLIKAELYTFLLQKKEENALMQAASTPKARIIDQAFNKMEPLSPKKNMVVMFVICMGLFLPAIFLYLKEVFKQKFSNKTELAQLTSLPIAGEICVNDTSDYVVAREGNTSSISELFRLLRTNLQFLLRSKDEKVILMTSSVSGEGKSFVSVNLAMSLALTHKKVLLIGLDIRSPKLMDYLNIYSSKGVTSYLASDSLSVSDVINHTSYSENLDVIFSGPVPPNPSELLLSDRIDTLFTEVREKYDYIIVDSAPVGVISDTFSLTRVADIILYVCRANYTSKDNINFINELVQNGKLKNVSLVINGTEAKQGYGYGYKNKATSGNLKKN